MTDLKQTSVLTEWFGDLDTFTVSRHNVTHSATFKGVNLVINFGK